MSGALSRFRQTRLQWWTRLRVAICFNVKQVFRERRLGTSKISDLRRFYIQRLFVLALAARIDRVYGVCVHHHEYD